MNDREPIQSRLSWQEVEKLLAEVNEQIPAVGQAATVQAELLRCFQNIEDESSRNGCANWDSHYDTTVRFIAAWLQTGSALDAKAKRLVRQKEYCVLVDPEFGPTQDFYKSLFPHLVNWLHSNPEPIPHDHDPDLAR